MTERQRMIGPTPPRNGARAQTGSTRRTRMLGSVWQLRDVTDVEDLCHGALIEMIRRTSPSPPLSPSEFEDTMAYLLGEVVTLEKRFRPISGIQFRPYLYDRLRLRAIDYWRLTFGRHGEKRVLGDGWSEGGKDDVAWLDQSLDVDARGANQLGGDVRDPTDDWLSDLGGLLPGRDRDEAGSSVIHVRSRSPRAGDQGRDPRSGAPARGRDAGRAEGQARSSRLGEQAA